MKVENFSSNFICFVFVILSFRKVFGEFCRLPSNEAGSCVLLNNCEILKKVALLKEENEYLKTYLKQSKCKNTEVPWVCCPIGEHQNLQARIDKIHQTKLLPANLGFCGRQINLAIRIVGGKETDPGDFPWHALLVYSKPFYMEGYHCGGSLITSSHVVTAAHCTSRRLYPSTWNLTKVRLGENDLSTIEDCKTSMEKPPKCGIAIDILNIIVHEHYTAKQGSQNDIAILKLKKTVQYSDYIMPICLAVKKNIHIDSGSGTVVGFGKTESGSSSDTLLKAEIDIQDYRECKKKYEARGIHIQRNQICASGNEADSCSGDSGGGFVRKDDNSTAWYLIGIVSYGTTMCNSDYPGVYVKVQNYIHWIKEKIRN